MERESLLINFFQISNSGTDLSRQITICEEALLILPISGTEKLTKTQIAQSFYHRRLAGVEAS